MMNVQHPGVTGMAVEGIDSTAARYPADGALAPPPRVRRLRNAARFVVFSVGLYATMCGVALVVPWNIPGKLAPHGLARVGTLGIALPFGLAAVLGLAAAGLGIRSVFSEERKRGFPIVLGALATTLTGLFMTLVGAATALLWTFGFARGRQIRSFGRIVLPSLKPGAAWSAALHRSPHSIEQVETACPSLSEAPAGLAAQWRQNGKTEHASVAAFARLTLDLMALGAPPSLIAAANRDALDEIRHAEICFSLARAMDGREEGPAPFPEAGRIAPSFGPRSVALARLAVASLIDGALHEGVSARIIAKLAKRCAVPAIRDTLKEIAADEGRHATHGWEVVVWCYEQSEAAVGAALAGAIRHIPHEMPASTLPEAFDGSWEPWGVHGRDLEFVEYARARANVVARVTALTGGSSHKTGVSTANPPAAERPESKSSWLPV